MTLSITIFPHHAECRILSILMLNVVMLSVIMLSVVMLSVVAPVRLNLESFIWCQDFQYNDT